MASLDTDFNVSPYFDDYDEDKRYHRMLFRPAVPLQARELTQLQTILQDQVERFGRYTFKEGSIIQGCTFKFSNSVKYAKILDKTAAGTDVNVGLFAKGDYVVNQANLVAQITDKKAGLQTQNPNLNTLFFDYINTGTGDEVKFAAGEVLTVYPSLAQITGITISNEGAGYSNSDTVVINSTNGSGFIGNVVTYAANGSIKEISVTANGTGYTFQDLPTVSVTSGNSSANGFAGAVNLSTIANVTIATSDFQQAGNTQFNVVGSSYQMMVSDGYIFQKGHFVKVDAQDIIVSPYTNIPHDLAVGFTTNEAIVNSSVDTTLLDNATGFNNENAPGADRLQLTANLVVNTTANAGTSNNFLQLVKFQNGKVNEVSKTARLNILGNQIAQRTYEESGDYVVKPFSIATEVRGAASGANTTHFNVVIGPGIAYPKGFRYETIGPTRLPIRKATDTANASSQTVTTNYGNYAQVNELVGQFEHKYGDLVLLLDKAHNSLSTGPTASLSGSEYNNTNKQVTYNGQTSNVIGTARVRSIELASDNAGRSDSKYNLYLFDIKMNSGKSFRTHAKAVYHYGGSAYTGANADTNQAGYGIADLVLTTNRALLIDQNARELIFPLGQGGIDTISDTISYVYKTSSNVTITAASGEAQFAVSDPLEFNFGTSDITLSSTQEKEVLVVPTESVNAASNLFTGATTNGNTTVTGADTTDLIIGDNIYLSNSSASVLAQVTGIKTDNIFTVNKSVASMTSVSGKLTYLEGVPVPFGDRSSAQFRIDNSGRRMTVDLGRALSADLDATVIHDLKDTSNAGLKKTIQESIVKIDTSTHSAGANGPWSLGIPDVYEIVAVYVDSSYTTSGTNRFPTHFTLDSNQQASFYGLSKLRKKASSSLNTTGKNITVVVRHFEKDTSVGQGFFSIKSYADIINDSVTSNTTIQTQDIPIYKSPVGKEFNLRNSIDFRTFPDATANTGDTLGNATENPSTLEAFSGVQYYPAPDSQWQSEVRYYLPRVDRVVLDGQNFKVLEGVPSVRPVPPATPGTMMSIAVVTIPVYPTLDAPQGQSSKRPDLAATVRATQLVRYTMRDIKSIDDRLKNLEYYTALNTLESLTLKKVVPGRSDPTLNRFKNGIMVDNMKDPVTANPTDQEFKAGYNPSRDRLTPKFEQYKLELIKNKTTNMQQYGDGVIIHNTLSKKIEQPRATNTRTCTSSYWKYNGTIELYPSYWDAVDLDNAPIKQNTIDIDLASVTTGIIDELNKVMPIVTQGAVLDPTSVSVQVEAGTPSTTGSVTTTAYNASVEFDTYEREASFSKTMQDATTREVGDYITDLSFSPYIPAIEIYFRGWGFRPNLVHHVFFDGKNVDSRVTPGEFKSKTTQTVNLALSYSTAKSLFSKTKAKGGELKSNKKGIVSGKIQIPAGTYFVGDRKVIIADIEELSDIGNKVSGGSTTFGCFNFSVEKQSIVVSTRTAIPSSASSARLVPVQQSSSFDVVDSDDATTNNINYYTPPDEEANTVDDTPANTDPIPTPNTPPPANTEPEWTCAEMVGQTRDWWEGIGQQIVQSRPAEWWIDCFGIDFEFDPLAQSFMVTAAACEKAKGSYIHAIELYFAEKDPSQGITFELRDMIAGVPGQNVLPYSRVRVEPEDIVVSTDGSKKTVIYFKAPVYVECGVEYAWVVLPDGNSPNYRLHTAKAGGKDKVSGRIHNQDWGQGSMFLSSNARTWKEIVDEDAKFAVYFNRMKSFAGMLELVNDDYEWVTAVDQDIDGQFVEKEEVFVEAANQTGTVSFTSEGTTIVGTSTNFTATGQPAVGDKIVLTNGTNRDVVTVSAISNSTYMTVEEGISFTSASAKYQFTPTGKFTRLDTNTGTVQISDSTATNSAFLFAAGDVIRGAQSGASFTINTVVDNNISYHEPDLTRMTPPQTETSCQVQAKKASASGMDVWRTVPYNGRTYPDVPVKVMSKSNEITNNSGAKSLKVRHVASTSHLQMSPFYDLQSQSITVYENVINNDTTNEYLGPEGQATAKYVSRVLELSDDLSAEDLKVFVRAYKPSGTDIKLYAKVISDLDSTVPQDTHWSLLQQVDPNLGKVSSSVDREDVIEYTYEFADTPQSTKKSGTVVTTSGSTTVTGTATAFTTDYSVGDLIKITQGGDDSTQYQLSKITAIANTTSLTIADEAPVTIAEGEEHYKVDAEYTRQAFRDPNAETPFMATYYNGDGEKFVGFKTLQIKIVMTSTSTFNAPTVDDFRAIAVSL